MNRKTPDEKECLKLLKEYGTPEHVIKHCMAVAQVAVRIGRRLNEKGYEIDIPLLRAACLLHDIARVEENHEAAGQRYLASAGYDRIAVLVGAHTKYRYFNSVDSISEIDLLCLGDRTVVEDRFTGPAERVRYIVEKARRNNIRIIEEKAEELVRYLENYIRSIENVIGITLDQVMKGDYE